MKTFYITFGVKYLYEPHRTLGLNPALPDGWATIEAEDEYEARVALRDLIDNEYAFLYDEQPSQAKYFKLGHLGDIREMVKRSR